MAAFSAASAACSADTVVVADIDRALSAQARFGQHRHVRGVRGGDAREQLG
jgi:hypothetical protein